MTFRLPCQSALKDFVKNRLSPVVDLLGIYDLLFHRVVVARPGWLILMYHRVVDDPALDPFRLGMCVSREHFRAQIEFLESKFNVITVADGMRRLSEGGRLPPKALSITFDDGYRDFITHALPVLREFDCPASVYIALDGLESGAPFWWDRVIDAFARTEHTQLEGRAVGLDADRQRLSLLPRRRREALVCALDYCWQASAFDIETRVDALCAELGVCGSSALLPARMSGEELAGLDPELVEIGAHCLSHTDITRHPPERALHEMLESRRRLRDITGRAIGGLAYPGGRQNRVVRSLAHAEGFDYALGTDKGLNCGTMDYFNLQRIGMPDTPVPDLKRSLSLAVRDPGERAATHHSP